MLTRKQYELLVFIDRHIKANGVPPSFDEMKSALALRSKSRKVTTSWRLNTDRGASIIRSRRGPPDKGPTPGESSR